MSENRKELCESREKYWSELDDTGKIDRMHRFVKMLMQEDEELKEKVQKLESHMHNHDGRMMIPFGNNHGVPTAGRIIGGVRRHDERYF